MNKDFGKNLWKHIFPVLSAVLWAVTLVLFFKSHYTTYSTDDFEAQRAIMAAARWLPACCIGAIISSAAAYVVSELAERIDK